MTVENLDLGVISVRWGHQTAPCITSNNKKIESKIAVFTNEKATDRWAYVVPQTVGHSQIIFIRVGHVRFSRCPISVSESLATRAPDPLAGCAGSWCSYSAGPETLTRLEGQDAGDFVFLLSRFQGDQCHVVALTVIGRIL
jgi:hypothetical protein